MKGKNMRREIATKLKVFNKQMINNLIEISKKYKVKKTSSSAWCKNDDLLFERTFRLFIDERDDSLKCSCMERIKPMWIDELLWNVIDMSENKKAPLSLRINGAYSYWGVSTGIRTTLINDWSEDEIKRYIDENVYELKKKSEWFTIDDFYELVSDNDEEDEIYNLLYLIHQQNLNDAILFAGTMKHNYFVNKGISLPEYAIKYCKAKIHASF